MQIFVLSILFVALVFVTAFAQEPDPNFSDKMALQESKSFIQKSAFKESLNYSQSDLVYQRMEWEINPNIKYIKGKVTSYFKSKINNLNEMEFDLHSLMTVDSVMQNSQKINFSRIDNKINLQLKNTIQEQQLDSVSIYYQGEPSSTTGFSAFTKGMHDGVPIIWTLSEPYGALEWWPCKQSLIDKIDSIDIIVTSPELYRTASNGILVSETVENGSRKMHWKHRYPITTYLVAIAVTNYVNYSDFLDLDDGRKIEILNYVYPENLAEAQSKTPVTTEIMKLFNELIGEYPFAKEKYGHAQFGWGGGMEHQTMSFMNNFEFGLVSHELAHQWFGDYITLGSWQHIWLNEGFATYLTGLSYEHLLDGIWWPLWKKLNVERIISEPDGSVLVTDTTNISTLFSGRLSYSKGAYLLHMLRWILGDDPFFNGIRNYFEDPEIANGFAQNDQLVKHLESAGDTSLTEFFDDWYYGEGFPIYSAQFSQNGSGTMVINLSQSTSHQSIDFFEMPVPVRAYNSGKTDSIDFRLNNKANNQEFRVEPGFDVSEIKIDPDYWLVSKTSEIVKVPWIGASDEFIIYPNPFSEKISVFIPSGQQLVSTKLFSSEGKLMAEFPGDKTTFDWSEIPKGVYIIQLKTSTKLFEQKIIKQ